tara:strand:+ start:252 stop:446 length:195 start_codon:yes stop_codon:yes gene_type:complete
MDKVNKNKYKVSTLIIVSITFSGINKRVKITAKEYLDLFWENVENIRYNKDIERLPKRILMSER